jgi:hypothetical protein
MSDDVTSAGKRLVERWQAADKGLNAAKSNLSKAECELSNSTRELAKWLMPFDAKINESFSVWYGDSLITAEKTGDHAYVISVRTRGRSLT